METVSSITNGNGMVTTTPAAAHSTAASNNGGRVEKETTGSLLDDAKANVMHASISLPKDTPQIRG